MLPFTNVTVGEGAVVPFTKNVTQGANASFYEMRYTEQMLPFIKRDIRKGL